MSKKINRRAFGYCFKLQIIEIDENSKLENICWYMFYTRFIEETKIIMIPPKLKNRVNKENPADIKARADNGDSLAIYKYAFMLQQGDQVQVNKTEAVKYYKMAIEKGNYSAMFNYAFMLEKEDNPSVSKSEAAKFSKMVADKGDARSMNRYAMMLEKG